MWGMCKCQMDIGHLNECATVWGICIDAWKHRWLYMHIDWSVTAPMCKSGMHMQTIKPGLKYACLLDKIWRDWENSTIWQSGIVFGKCLCNWKQHNGKCNMHKAMCSSI